MTKVREIFYKLVSNSTLLYDEMLAPIQLYMGRTYDQSMTRKDKMREGYVARTIHIPLELDDTHKMLAIKNHIRFSDMAIIAFKDFFSRQREAN